MPKLKKKKKPVTSSNKLKDKKEMPNIQVTNSLDIGSGGDSNIAPKQDSKNTKKHKPAFNPLAVLEKAENELKKATKTKEDAKTNPKNKSNLTEKLAPKKQGNSYADSNSTTLPKVAAEIKQQNNSDNTAATLGKVVEPTKSKKSTLKAEDPSKTDKIGKIDKIDKISDVTVKAFAEQIAELGFDPFFITDKLIEFGLLLTGIPLYQYQKDSAWRIIYSVLTKEGATLTMLFARQSGKSETIAFICATLTVMMPVLAKLLPILDEFKDGFAIGLFAPQYEQVTTTYMRTMSKLKSDVATEVMSDDDIKTGLVSAHKIKLSNGSHMMGQVACKTSKIESKTYHLVIIEEAQDTDDLLVAKSIEPMMTATLGTLVKVGTTGTKKGDFWYEIQRNHRRSIGKYAGKLRFHFQYDYKEIIRQKREQFNVDKKVFHLNYEKFIAQQIEKRGVNHEAFKLAYALIWALDAGMFITDTEWNSMLNKHKKFTRIVDKKWDVRAGMDIAKDKASTVITIGHRFLNDKGKLEKEVFQIIDLGGYNYEEQYHLVCQIIDDYNVNVLFADYTGVGKPVVDRLLANVGAHCEIRPYTFSRPSKSDMWFNLRNTIDINTLTIPAHATTRDTVEYQKLESQLKGMNKYYEGSYLVAHKGTDSDFDDYGDSLGLFSLACEVELVQGSAIEQFDFNPFYANSNIVQEIKNAGWH